MLGTLEAEEFELSRWGQGAIGATGRMDHWGQGQEVVAQNARMRHRDILEGSDDEAPLDVTEAVRLFGVSQRTLVVSIVPIIHPSRHIAEAGPQMLSLM